MNHLPTTPHDILFISGSEGTPLAVRRYLPSGEVGGVVIIQHGIVSHGGWYAASASHLAAQGYAVYLPDRRGSGLNGGKVADIDRWQTWANDLLAITEQVKNGHRPVLVGISWGGKLAPAVVRERPDLFAGCAMICPGIFARQQPGLLKRGLMRVGLRLGRGQRRVTIPLRDASLFTNTPGWQQYIANDPLTLREVTLRLASADVELTRHVRRSAPWIRTPSLLVVAGRDPITRNEATRRWFGQIGAAEKVVYEYPASGHTLEFETDPGPYLDDLAEWIDRVSQRPDHRATAGN